jgi:hypothetical protein
MCSYSVVKKRRLCSEPVLRCFSHKRINVPSSTVVNHVPCPELGGKYCRSDGCLEAWTGASGIAPVDILEASWERENKGIARL